MKALGVGHDGVSIPGTFTGPYQGAYTAMGAYGRYTTVLPVLDLVVAHKVAFDEEDERQGRPIAEVSSHEYDAILQMIIARRTNRSGPAIICLAPSRMNTASIVSRAFEVFRTDAAAPPPLTLRGGNAVDSYSQPMPFDPAEDEPTDAYLEGFAFWGLGYLDARSWRHYLPRLIDYAFRRPNDPAMVTEALVRSLRPPERYPPRLATLSAD
jgi:hypothetical protein